MKYKYKQRYTEADLPMITADLRLFDTKEIKGIINPLFRDAQYQQQLEEKYDAPINTIRKIADRLYRMLRWAPMNCEVCGTLHDRLYGSGRFCSKPCARRFNSEHGVKESSFKFL